MKAYQLFLIVVFTAFNIQLVKGQRAAAPAAAFAPLSKPILDTNAFKNWPGLSNGNISPNGKYVSYNVSNIVNEVVENTKLVVTDTAASWQVEVPEVLKKGEFSENNAYAVFTNRHDSLGMVALKEKKIQYLDTVIASGLYKNMLVYQAKLKEEGVVLTNLDTGLSKRFKNAKEYRVNANGTAILIVSEPDADGKSTISYYDFKKEKLYDVCTVSGLMDLGFSPDGQYFAYIAVEDKNWKIWLQQAGASQAKLAGQFTMERGAYLSLSGITGIQDNNRFIIFEAIENIPQVKRTPLPNYPSMDIWNFQDKKIQSYQLKEKKKPIVRFFSADVETKRISEINQGKQQVLAIAGKVALLGNWYSEGIITEANWNPDVKYQYLVKPLTTDSALTIPGFNMFSARLSPEGKYVSYFDDTTRRFNVYDVAAAVVKDITPPQNLYGKVDFKGRPDTLPERYWVEGYVKGDKGILLSDGRDIWMLSLNQGSNPVNLTGGQGIKSNTIFKLVTSNPNKVVEEGEAAWLAAFDYNTKNNGYYRVTIASKPELQKQIMAPYLFYAPGLPLIDTGAPLIKAQQANVYLVPRMNEKQSPNLYVTTAFQHFKAVSENAPEQGYNWLAARLLNFDTYNANKSRGILYMPENFDPSQKYPVIIHCQEKLTNNLHVYLPAQACTGDINIPWFVSRGYLVFMPDIYYKLGDPGPSSLEYIESAAKFLGSQDFVDSTRIAIQGRDFGAYEINYVVTHSDSSMFRAAAQSAGVCNFLSNYSSITANGASNAYNYEYGPYRMGGTFWDMPDKFLENSPIMAADKVSIPLLMQHNQQDSIVPFIESFQFFGALWSLEKNVWMLDYDNESHTLKLPENKMDYTIRITQFFDHYLKNAGQPVWMSQGIPAHKKGIIDGLELDNTAAAPPAQGKLNE